MSRRVVFVLLGWMLCAVLLHGAPVAGERANVNLCTGDCAGWKMDVAGGGSGDVKVEKEKGGATLKVTADLTAEADKNGTYAALTREFDDLKVAAVNVIVFKLKTENVTKMTLRFIDATGQTFQRRAVVLPDGANHEFTLAAPEGKVSKIEFFGGANDGVVHQPIKSVAISFPKGCSADDKPVATLSALTATVTK